VATGDRAYVVGTEAGRFPASSPKPPRSHHEILIEVARRNGLR
jgi:hypothetical protein